MARVFGVVGGMEGWARACSACSNRLPFRSARSSCYALSLPEHLLSKRDGTQNVVRGSTRTAQTRRSGEGNSLGIRGYPCRACICMRARVLARWGVGGSQSLPAVLVLRPLRLLAITVRCTKNNKIDTMVFLVSKNNKKNDTMVSWCQKE